MSLGSFFKSAVGLASGTAGLGTLAGIAGAGIDYFSAKSLQDDAQSHQAKFYRNQHQWEVEDLRKAGLNPILSAHKGSSAPSAGIASASPASAAINSARALADIRNTNARTNLVNTQADALSGAATGSQIVSTYLSEAAKTPGLVKEIGGRLWKVIKQTAHSAKTLFNLKRKLANDPNAVKGRDYYWDKNGHLHIMIRKDSEDYK